MIQTTKYKAQLCNIKNYQVKFMPRGMIIFAILKQKFKSFSLNIPLSEAGPSFKA